MEESTNANQIPNGHLLKMHSVNIIEPDLVIVVCLGRLTTIQGNEAINFKDGRRGSWEWVSS